MKIRATITKGEFLAGKEYDLPEEKAKAAIMAGIAEPLVIGNPARERDTAVKPQYETRWPTR